MFVQKFSALSVLFLLLSSATALANPLDLENGDIHQNEIQLAQNRPGRGQQEDVLSEALNLTEDQQEQIQNIRQNYRPQIQQKRQMLQTLRQELNDLFASNVSAEELRDKQSELSQFREDINNLNFESIIEIREILTLEQRQKFHDFMQQRGSDRPRRNR
jgi:protein CpxP